MKRTDMDDSNGVSCPLLSVVLCAYNAEKYIAETIDSVLSQSFADYEFIIWNDGATDKTEEIILCYDDARIIYRKDINRGFGPASKLACMLARGKYIARIDSDDVCMPDRFKREIAYLESHPKAVMVSSEAYFIDEESETIGRYFTYTYDFIIQRMLRRGICTLVHPSSMYRTEAYRACGGYSNSRHFQDLILWRKLAKHGRMAVMPSPLIKYRLLSSSLMHTSLSGPYANILNLLKAQIVGHDAQEQEELDLYYHIVQLNKGRMNMNKKITYVPKVEERVYYALKTILGEKMSIMSVHVLKNIYGFIKILFIKKI